jgi:hypothetical protein
VMARRTQDSAVTASNTREGGEAKPGQRFTVLQYQRAVCRSAGKSLNDWYRLFENIRRLPASAWPSRAIERRARQRSGIDPGCVKTIRAPKPGERFSQIARNLPRSETVVALIAIRRDSCSINFPRRGLFTQPRPLTDFQGRQYGAALKHVGSSCPGLDLT